MTGTRAAGEAIAQAAEPLARVWRSARVDADPKIFPGAIDGIVASFVAAVGDALLDGRPPEDAWTRTEGVLCVDPDPVATADALRAEATLVGEVLASACETLEAPHHVTDFAARAVEALRQALARLGAGDAPPPGVLVVTLLSGFRPRNAGPR